MRTPILYLVAIAAAELVTILASPVAGVVLHVLILLTLVAHASFASQHPIHKLYLALALAPLVRILSLSMPLGSTPILYWYAIIAVPLLTATFVSIRLLGYSRCDVGLALGKLPLQLAVGLMGLPLGVVEYVILKPRPLADSSGFGAIWLPVLILVVGTGFTEELVFRGVLQKAALENMRGWGLFYGSVVFALLHVGYYSVVELVFVFAVGLAFAWVVRSTGSVLGTTLAHGLLNSTLFLFVPLWGLSVLPVETIKVPDIAFLPQAADTVALSTPTATSSPMPALVPTETPLVRLFVTGTDGSGVKLRQSPGLSGEVIRICQDGSWVEFTGEVARADGYTWWKVLDSLGNVGWVAADYLGPVYVPPTPTPTRTPTPTPARTPTPTRTQTPTPVRTPTPAPVHTPTPARLATSTPQPTPGGPQSATPMVYTVQPGDTLSSIARRFGTTVDKLMALNGLTNRSVVLAGQRLRVPVAVHIVARGETLAGIARAYGTTVQEILELNELENPSLIFAGQRLLVPLGGE